MPDAATATGTLLLAMSPLPSNPILPEAPTGYAAVGAKRQTVGVGGLERGHRLAVKDGGIEIHRHPAFVLPPTNSRHGPFSHRPELAKFGDRGAGRLQWIFENREGRAASRTRGRAGKGRFIPI